MLELPFCADFFDLSPFLWVGLKGWRSASEPDSMSWSPPFRADLLFDLLPFLLVGFCGGGSASETASVSSGSPFRADLLFDLPPFLLLGLDDGTSGSSVSFSLVAPPVAGATLTGCLSRVTGHVTRRRMRAFMTGIGCQAMSAFMASNAWLFADLLGATPVHSGLF